MRLFNLEEADLLNSHLQEHKTSFSSYRIICCLVLSCLVKQDKELLPSCLGDFLHLDFLSCEQDPLQFSYSGVSMYYNELIQVGFLSILMMMNGDDYTGCLVNRNVCTVT